MTSDRWHRIEEICYDALTRPVDERSDFVDRACAGDEELRCEVTSLLEAANRDPSFLETPAARVAPLTPDKATDRVHGEGHGTDTSAERAEERIGPYRIVRSIGRGGMGHVYLAVRDDEAFTRYVALKVIRQGLDTEDVLERFVAERQILASLNHENIARLFDGGRSEDGRPYFVMEYVEGVPITDYCDDRCLPIEDRLRLFDRVCRAVHHAHRNLVVHRDLKPSNILVTPHGHVKLLDFGIAKILDPEAADVKAPITRTEQRLLTPEYASPEQVKGDVITTASDVYALGVLLYELLTGRPPYRIPDRIRREIERVICEEEPTRPSEAVTRTEEIVPDSDDTHTISPDEVSAARATHIDQLRRRLSGDLDTIVMMTMRKEPERRYGSAEQLGEDVRRHLDGLPVIARADTMSYRAAKFVRRHQWGVLWAGVFTVLLVASTIVAAWQANTIRRQAEATEAERDRAEQVSAFLMSVFEASDPAEARGDTLAATELLKRGTERIRHELADQPARQAEMMGVMSEVYLNMGRHDDAERLAADALEIQRGLARGDHAALAAAVGRLGRVHLAIGAFGEAESLFRQAIDLQIAAHGTDHVDVAAARSALATAHYDQGNFGEAERLYREAIRIKRGVLDPDDPGLARTMSSLGVLLRETGRIDEAESLYREALGIQRAAFGSDHPDVVRTLNNLAVVLRDRGDLEGAEEQMREVLEIHRRILGPDHPDVGTSINNLAVVLREQGKLEEAEPFYREALDLHERIYGETHPHVAVSLNNLGRVLRQKGEDDAAEPYYRRALEMRRRLLGDDHPSVAVSLNNLASLQRDRGHLNEAQNRFEEALGILRASVGDEHVAVAIALNNLARTHYLAGRYADAETAYVQSLDVYESAGQGNGPRVTGSMIGLGMTLIDAGRPEEALPHLERANSIRSSALSSDGLPSAEARAALGVCLALLGQSDEAEQLLVNGVSVMEEHATADEGILRKARWALEIID